MFANMDKHIDRGLVLKDRKNAWMCMLQQHVCHHTSVNPQIDLAEWIVKSWIYWENHPGLGLKPDSLS
jgi:hypothetical protein